MYDSKFRRTSLIASPPNFSRNASAKTRATMASPTTAAGGHRAYVASLYGRIRRPIHHAYRTLGRRFLSVDIGFIAPRTTNGSPVVIPPSSPPARFDDRPMWPDLPAASSATIAS